MQDRLHIIHEKLKRLIATDTEFKIFGSNEPWNGHHYELNPTLSEDDIRNFEEAAEVKLPADYRLYLSQIADGGAGPYYGLRFLQAAVEEAINNYDTVGEGDPPQLRLREYFQPFPISAEAVQSYIRAVEEIEDDELQPFDLPPTLSGILFLSEYGCGGYYVLVVQGEQAGTVWFFQSGEYLQPIFNNGKQWGFFDWFENWIDRSLLELTNPDALYKNPVEDPLQVKRLVYDQQELKTIPDEVFQCRNLRHLTFSRNALKTIPPALFELAELRILDLNFNQFSKIPAGIGSFPHLRKLNLSYNSKLKTLPDAIGNLGNLRKLDLAYCTSLQRLPDSIGQLRQLERLNLFSCDVLELPDSIGDMAALETLQLDSNRNLTRLPESIGRLGQLRTLSLEWTGVTALPASFAQLTGLEWLNLDIEAADWADVFAKIAALTGLQYLKIRAVPEYPLNIADLKVKTLFVGKNYTVEISQLPNSLCMARPEHLDLSEANAALPAHIGTMTALQKLTINSTQAKQLPASFQNLQGLSELQVIAGFQLSDAEKETIQKLIPNTKMQWW
ncbi:MAG: leucine-rich repeat domain-containing protein [Anaerolineales bacterium]|nr:leucine-rich repeat domain-containing protein [Anaerolineales bacterium]